MDDGDDDDDDDDDVAKNDLIEVLNYPHKKTAKKFKCFRCSKSYTLQKNLRRHLTYECLTGPRYNCQYCKKKFNYQFLLRRHYEKCIFYVHNKWPK